MSARLIDITFKGVELEVRYDYEPAEPQTWDHPGYPAQCDVITVAHKGDDITELFDWDALERISEKVMDEMGFSFEGSLP